MRTRFFPDGFQDCPLIAITDFRPSEVESLYEAVTRPATGEDQVVVVEGDVQLKLLKMKGSVLKMKGSGMSIDFMLAWPLPNHPQTASKLQV